MAATEPAAGEGSHWPGGEGGRDVAFVRYSVMSPKTGEAERLKGLIEQLIDYHREQAGFVTEFLIEPDEHDLHAFMGPVRRVGVGRRRERGGLDGARHRAAVADQALRRR